MSAPKLSVIVPVYNAGKYLNRCVDSILSQDYSEFELLLIDDGSKDTSPAICDEYTANDSRVIVIHKENGGVSSARNVGLNHARGEWICFIDADDFISPHYFSIINHCYSDIVFLVNDRIHQDGLTYVTYSIPICRSSNIREYRQIIGENLVNPVLKVPWAKIIKRSCIDNLRFNENQTIGEDTLFIYQLLNKCSSVESRGDAIYYWQDEDKGGDAVKYHQTPRDSARYASNIYRAYKSLNIPSLDVEAFIVCYFWNLCHSDDIQSYEEWFSNEDIQAMNNNLRRNRPSVISSYYWHYSLPIILQRIIRFGWKFAELLRTHKKQ